MNKIDPSSFQHIVFFTGAGMSAESGVPTYRGEGGIWHEFRWQDYACQTAFERDPGNVLEFHELRRQEALKCQPHRGHEIVTAVQQKHDDVTIVTQNIDGMHQRAGSKKVIELHGSLWRVRCDVHGVWPDLNETYTRKRCAWCDSWLRPDIIWFEDMLDQAVVDAARQAIYTCDLFISIGTSASVWPAAGYPSIARNHGAYCIEINPEPTENSEMYQQAIRGKAGQALAELFV
jgi:NAD-dependent deacetylase